jgi:hypothetical protein
VFTFFTVKTDEEAIHVVNDTHFGLGDNVAQAASDAACNLYLTGSFRQSLTFGTIALTGSGNDEGYLVKYSPQGIEQWAQALTSPEPDFLEGLCVDAVRNVYITSSFDNQAHIGNATLTSAGQSDIVVAAYTTQGQLSWVQQAGGLRTTEASAWASPRKVAFGYLAIRDTKHRLALQVFIILLMEALWPS